MAVPLPSRCSLRRTWASSAGGEERGEEGFAGEEWEVAGVVAFEVEEVEAEEGERVAGAVLEGGLEEGEVGGAVGGEDDDFAVEGDGVGGQGGDGGGDGGDAVGPVEAAAGEHLDFGTGFAGLHAVAVELELVEPAGGLGRLCGFEGELGLDEGGLEFFGEVVEGGVGC